MELRISVEKVRFLLKDSIWGDDKDVLSDRQYQGMTPERLYEVQGSFIRTGERAGFGLYRCVERIALLLWSGLWTEDFFTEGEGTVAKCNKEKLEGKN